MIRGIERHADFIKLNEIGKAMMRKNGYLPTVRRDSHEWKAWALWFAARGLECRWSASQPPETPMTVVTEYPPVDVDELHEHWVKNKGTKLDLVE